MHAARYETVYTWYCPSWQCESTPHKSAYVPDRGNVAVEELRPLACVAGSGAALCARAQSAGALKAAHSKGL